jgi:hypothetical protein
LTLGLSTRSSKADHKPTSGAIFLGEEFDGAGETSLFLKVVRQHGLEGMVSKRVDLAMADDFVVNANREHEGRPATSTPR